jgi:hypothetical protein
MAKRSGPVMKPVRRKPGAWTEKIREAFLAALSETANVAASARAVKRSRHAAYAERRRNPAFAKAWDAAITIALDELEMALLERATFGVEKDVFYGGEKRGSVRHYSDALAMFILRARRPETYGKGAGSDGQELSANDARTLIEARLAAIEQEQEERKR